MKKKEKKKCDYYEIELCAEIEIMEIMSVVNCMM